MNSCNTNIPTSAREDGTLNVSEKYKQLMLDSVSEDSLYLRAKDTFKVIFDDLQLTEKEKAQVVAEHVASMTTSLSGAAMQTALSWEKEERDGAYTLAKIKADTDVSIANGLKAQEEICLMQKQTELQCANITATLSGTIRENGNPTLGADGCTVTGLDDTGLKYEQTQQVKAATYKDFADAYRKSGVVQIGTDVQDNVYKGLSGGTDPIVDGYTNQQSLNAERQRVGFEDSKVSHAANSSATMIASMMASEIGVKCEDVARWRTAVDRLLSKGEDMSDIPDGFTPSNCSDYESGCS